MIWEGKKGPQKNERNKKTSTQVYCTWLQVSVLISEGEQKEKNVLRIKKNLFVAFYSFQLFFFLMYFLMDKILKKPEWVQWLYKGLTAVSPEKKLDWFFLGGGIIFW